MVRGRLALALAARPGDSPVHGSPVRTSRASLAVRRTEAKYPTGVRGSAWNNRYVAMKQATEDLRPFGGAPFDPKNTFITTGPSRASTRLETGFPPQQFKATSSTDVNPFAPTFSYPMPAPSEGRTLSWATVKASR